MKAMLRVCLGLLVAGFVASPLTAAPVELKKDRKTRVACVGDSITFGSGIADRNNKNYPAQLQQLLGDAWEVKNFGVSARTLLRKGNFPYWNEKAYQDALAFQPDVVVIMLGTNDTKPQNWAHKDEFRKDYEDLVKSFTSLPTTPRVFVCLPPPVVGGKQWDIVEEGVQQEMPLIKDLARDLKLDVIDMHKALEAKPQLIPDRVHPNAEGAGIMAAEVYQAFTGKKAPQPVPAK